MADEEEKFRTEDKMGTTDIQDGGPSPMARFAGNIIDAYAQSSPLFAGIAAMANTEGYQAKQAQIEANKQRLLEWNRNKGLREKQSKAAEMQADEYLNNADLRQAQNDAGMARAQHAKTYYAQGGTADQISAANAAGARLRQQQADYAYVENRNQQGSRDMVKALRAMPAFSGHTDSEINDAAKSPAVRALIEQHWLVSDFADAVQNGNTQKQGFLTRLLENQKIGVEAGETADQNGNKINVQFAVLPNGRKIPMTPQGLEQTKKEISAAVGEELRTRLKLSEKVANTNPIVASERGFVQQVSKYNGNSWAAGQKLYNAYLDKASPEEREWLVVNQAIHNYRSGGPQEFGLASLQALMTPPMDQQGNVIGSSILDKMGFTVSGIDMKTGNLANVTLKKKDTDGSWRTYNFDEFCRLSEESDTLGHRLTGRINMMKDAALRQDKVLLARDIQETNAALKAANDANRNKGNGKSGSAPETQAAENVSPEEKERAAAISYGKQFADKEKISDQVASSWNAIKSNNKTKLRNADDFSIAIGQAVQAGQRAFADTGNWKEADDSYRNFLKEVYKVPESLIPDIPRFDKNVVSQSEQKIRELRDKEDSGIEEEKVEITPISTPRNMGMLDTEMNLMMNRKNNDRLIQSKKKRKELTEDVSGRRAKYEKKENPERKARLLQYMGM